MFEFAALATALLGQSRALLPSWLPAGKLRGHEFVVGNLAGEPGDSLSINVNTGAWADFAGGDAGGDLISLYAAIHRISQADAARQLGADIPAQRTDKERRRVITPVPIGAPSCKCVHYQYGDPAAVWAYRDAAGELIGYVARYQPRNAQERETLYAGRDKQIIPWTYGAKGDRTPAWGMGQWPDPRPLYGLDDLARRPEAPVLIVEGEKSADAARTLVTSYVVVTWPGGSQAWKKAGWDVLAKRTVLLWPDADDAGIKCMDSIGRYLIKICPVVKLILPELQDGWDAADAVQEGWDWARVKEWALQRITVVTEGGAHAGNASASTGMAAQSAAGGNAQPGNGSHGTGSGGSAGAAPVLIDRGDSSAGAEAAPSKLGRWLAWNLDRVGNGDPAANLNNAVAVLEHDPSLKGHVWYDEFLDRMLTGSPAREWRDFDEIHLTLYMQRTIGLTKISKDIVSQAVQEVAMRDVRNCVRDWLETLSWDREPRIDLFFEDHFGAAGTSYTRSASRNFFISLVARAYRPGCKADYMVVLEGAQGVGKSNALDIIGGSWFTEQHLNASDSKEFAEVLQGKWLVEIAEMDAFSRSEVTKVKAVITNRNDRFRGSYKRYAEDHPRRCVFVGTTNKDDWNRDETGARRFWPIRCKGDVDTQAIALCRDQLFAEAVARFKSGESWWQMPAEETRKEQRDRYQEDPWTEIVQRFISHEEIGSAWVVRPTPLTIVSVNELLRHAVGLPPERWSRLEEMRVSAILKHAGWRRKKRADGWRYVKEVDDSGSSSDNAGW